MWNLKVKTELIEIEELGGYGRLGVWSEWGEAAQRYNLSVIRVSSEDLICHMITMGTNIILYT